MPRRNPFQRQPDQETKFPRSWDDISAAEPAGSEANSAAAHILEIPAATWQPKPRKKDTRRREPPRKISLIPNNKKRIEAYANQLNVPVYELVRYLLEYGLEQVERGNLHFNPQLSPVGLTLYPQEAKPRRSRSKRLDLIKTAYRGIPDETWNRLKNLAIDYPMWQVINKLIEFGIAQLDDGALVLTPQHVGAKTLY